MSSSTLPSGLDIAELSGPVLLGYLLNWGLLGSLVLQLYLYYQAFPNDVVFNKCLVYAVCTLEFVQTMLMTHDAFATFGYGFSELSALTSLGLEWVALPIMSGLVAFIGQSFYAYRVYVLSKSWRTPMFIIVAALTSSIGAFVHGSVGHQYRTFSLGSSREIYVSAAVWLFGSAMSDVISAACLTYYLSKNNIGFRSTRIWIHNMIGLTIETGSLTALMALVHLTLFFAFPSKPFFFTAAAVQSKLYANTILAVLNSRFQIVGGRGYTPPSADIIMDHRNGSRGSTVRSVNSQSPVLPTHREVFAAKKCDELVEQTG